MKEKKRIIFARKLIVNGDTYHAALEFYKYFYRHKSLVKKPKYKKFYDLVENYIIERKIENGFCRIEERKDYTANFRFINELDSRHQDRVFIFTPMDVKNIKKVVLVEVKK